MKIPLCPLILRISILRVGLSQKSDTSFIYPTRIYCFSGMLCAKSLEMSESIQPKWVGLPVAAEWKAGCQTTTDLFGHINRDIVPKSREVIFSIYFILTRFLGSGDECGSETLRSEEVTRKVRVLKPSTRGEGRSFCARSARSRTNPGDKDASFKPLQGQLGTDGHMCLVEL